MSEESAHALLGASGAHRWAKCPASLRAEKHTPRTSSKYADEGTAAHTLAAWTLENAAHPKVYPEKTIHVNGHDWPVTQEMITAVEDYRQRVLGYVTPGAQLLVEQRVCYASWIGVTPDLAFGTSDSVILTDDEIRIVDLKYGMGERVDAEDNEQLRLYALGALYEYEMLGDFKSVTVAISQPRIGHFSEQTYSVTDLKTFALWMKAAAFKALDHYELDADPPIEAYVPGDKQCRWCSAKATCPALRASVETETRDFFAPMLAKDDPAVEVPVLAEIPPDELGYAMSRVDLWEYACKAVRAEAERRLLVGQPVTGFKLVEGRKGNRSWADEDEAEKLIKTFRMRQDEMYKFTLKGPPDMEKVLKVQSPTRWKKLEKLIVRKDGKPSVAPDSDKRPALPTSGMNDSFAALGAEASVEDLV